MVRRVRFPCASATVRFAAYAPTYDSPSTKKSASGLDVREPQLEPAPGPFSKIAIPSPAELLVDPCDLGLRIDASGADLLVSVRPRGLTSPVLTTVSGDDTVQPV